MACPMRFVLAGISAILAFFLIWKNSNTKDIGCEDSDEGRKIRSNLNALGYKGKSWGRLVLDMFTGRFLWQLYASQEQGEAHVKVQ